MNTQKEKLSRRGLFGLLGKATVAAPLVGPSIVKAIKKPPYPAAQYRQGFNFQNAKWRPGVYCSAVWDLTTPEERPGFDQIYK